MAGFTVTSRVGPQVHKEHFGTLDEALAALDLFVRAGAAPAPAREVLGREYAPERQVSGRFELRGPGARGGVDVRGDGSAEAFTGWIRRQLVEQRDGESAVEALARVLRTRR